MDIVDPVHERCVRGALLNVLIHDVRNLMRALVVGYFSTVGDIEVLRQVERHLRSADIRYDVGAFDLNVSEHMPDAVDIYRVDPGDYSHLLIVCGPFNSRHLVKVGLDLDRFAHCTRVGVNLTMLQNLEVYNPLDALVGRDSNLWTVPDISFLEDTAKVPVAGLCLARNQPEYGARVRHDVANGHLRRLARRAGLATIELDTEWPGGHNTTGVGSPEEFEAICGRLDVMLTTRLHGMALALKNGVPVVALDAIAGGGKVGRQAQAIGWTDVLTIDDVSDDALDASLARCLQPDAGDRARSCADAARAALRSLPDDLATALDAAPQGLPSGTRMPGWLRVARHLNPRRAARDALRRRRWAARRRTAGTRSLTPSAP
jgi:hypothetical protein